MSTSIVITDKKLIDYIFEKYTSAEKILQGLGIPISDGSTRKKGVFLKKVGTFPRKYIGEFNKVLRNSMKITLFNRKRILLKPNTTEVSGFLIGKGPKGTEKLEYIEKGSRPSESYFFFSVEYQKRYGMVLKGTDKRTVKNRKRRGLKPNTKPRKQFDIIGGREGFGIMAKWENFSPRSQGMLKSIYGKKPSWPGFEGLNIGGRLLAHIKSRGAAEDMVNTDKTVLEYINSLYKFDLSKADIVFNDLSFEPDKTVARGTAKIKQDERKLEATNRGPFSKFDEIIARVVVEMFSK